MSSALSVSAPLSARSVFAVYSRHYNDVRRWVAARSRTFGDDDVAAEGAFRVYLVLRREVEGGASFPSDGAVRNFLSRTAFFVGFALRDELLRARRVFVPDKYEGDSDDDAGWEPAHPGPAPDAVASGWETAHRVAEVRASLAPRQRDLLDGLLEGEGQEELGARLGASPGTLRVRTHRLRAELRDRLGGEGFPLM